MSLSLASSLIYLLGVSILTWEFFYQTGSVGESSTIPKMSSSSKLTLKFFIMKNRKQARNMRKYRQRVSGGRALYSVL